jgi:hypothetical protein
MINYHQNSESFSFILKDGTHFENKQGDDIPTVSKAFIPLVSNVEGARKVEMFC